MRVLTFRADGACHAKMATRSMGRAARSVEGRADVAVAGDRPHGEAPEQPEHHVGRVALHLTAAGAERLGGDPLEDLAAAAAESEAIIQVEAEEDGGAPASP